MRWKADWDVLCKADWRLPNMASPRACTPKTTTPAALTIASITMVEPQPQYDPKQFLGTVSHVAGYHEWRLYWCLNGVENAMYCPASRMVPRRMRARRASLLRQGATCSTPRIYRKSEAWLLRIRLQTHSFSRRFDVDKWGAQARRRAEILHQEYCRRHGLLRHREKEI